MWDMSLHRAPYFTEPSGISRTGHQKDKTRSRFSEYCSPRSKRCCVFLCYVLFRRIEEVGYDYSSFLIYVRVRKFHQCLFIYCN